MTSTRRRLPLADYLARLELEPLTSRQLGAIHGEWRRLGCRDPWDRPARLELTAALARVPVIATTKELTEGEAGRVVHALRGCATLAEARELAELAELEHQDAPPAPVVTIGQAVLAAAITWHLITREQLEGAEALETACHLITRESS